MPSLSWLYENVDTFDSNTKKLIKQYKKESDDDSWKEKDTYYLCGFILLKFEDNINIQLLKQCEQRIKNATQCEHMGEINSMNYSKNSLSILNKIINE